jgi:hypothetical protein
MNQQEKILNKIVRLGRILKDLHRNSSDTARVPPKQNGQRFPAPEGNFFEQAFVGKFGLTGCVALF